MDKHRTTDEHRGSGYHSTYYTYSAYRNQRMNLPERLARCNMVLPSRQSFLEISSISNLERNADSTQIKGPKQKMVFCNASYDFSVFLYFLSRNDNYCCTRTTSNTDASARTKLGQLIEVTRKFAEPSDRRVVRDDSEALVRKQKIRVKEKIPKWWQHVKAPVSGIRAK